MDFYRLNTNLIYACVGLCLFLGNSPEVFSEVTQFDSKHCLIGAIEGGSPEAGRALESLTQGGLTPSSAKSLIQKLQSDRRITDKDAAFEVLTLLKDVKRFEDPVAQNELRSIIRNLNQYSNEGESFNPSAVANIIERWSDQGRKGLLTVLEDANGNRGLASKTSASEYLENTLKKMKVSGEKRKLLDECLKGMHRVAVSLPPDIPSPTREYLSLALGIGHPYSSLEDYPN